jgi:hypothetical protein
MIPKSRILAVTILLLLFVGVPGFLLLKAREYTEHELLARIGRESDPVKKAKYEIQLGRLKLQQAVQAYAKDDIERGQALLAAYLDRMTGAWEILHKSGRPAVKKPQGFRELDIALREDTRLLEDLKRRTPYLDRAPLERIANAVEKLHDQVLEALFPSLKNQASGFRSAEAPQPQPICSEASG